MRIRLLLAAVLVLPGLCPAAGARKQQEQRYAAVLMDGKEIGHMVSQRTAADGEVIHETRMKLQIKRGSVALKITVEITTAETPVGTPLRFRVNQDMGILAMKSEGTIVGGKLTIKTGTGGQTRTSTRAWPEGALLGEGLDRLARSKGLAKGTTYTAKVFDPSSLRALDATVVVGEKKEIDVLGRVAALTEVKTTMGTALGQVTETGYVTDDFRVLKTIMPLMGMKMEVLDCSKEFALSPNDPPEFFDKGLLASPKALTGLANATSADFVLTPKGQAKLRVPNSDAQKVTAGKTGAIRVAVRRLKPPAGLKLPYTGPDQAARAALKPTRILQSDHKKVAGLAKKAVGDAQDAADAARRIRDFVHKYIRKKDLSVGYATAAEVAQSRQGDCTEHAVLAAAMCRAAGIPAQVVTGLTYVPQFGARKRVFGPHAWFRVWLGGTWVPYDAALPHGWDVSHIALAAGDGDTGDFFQLVNTLGYFTIQDVTLTP